MLEIRGLSKTYMTKGAPPVRALIDVSVKLEHTGMVFVLGKSGSGKSTFLNVVGGLDKYDSGEIIIKGKSSKEFKGSDFDSYRNTYLGFIFQEYNLINEFSVGRNIALAMELQNRTAQPADVEAILQKVELGGLADRMPMQVSGGQRQRVAIARALIKDPEIIMADEPTGALDSATGASIFQTLQNLAKTRLVLIVSHDREFAEQYGDRIIEFRDGRIVSDMIKKGEDFEEVADTGEVQKVEEIIEVSQKANLSQEHMNILGKLLYEKRLEQSNTSRRVKRGSFINTKEEMLDMQKGNETPFRLIKSRLPQKNALKMATSSMKNKRIRLVFSILLSVIAVTLFGFSNVVGNFNERGVAKSLIRDYGYQHMVVSKSLQTESSLFSGGEGGYVSFTEKEKQEINEITDGGYGKYIEINEYLRVGDYGQTNSDINTDYYSHNIKGLVVCTDFESLGLDVPAVYGRYPESPNEILITNYMAETYLTYGILYIENNQQKQFFPTHINDVLSYNIELNAYGIVKIVGIVNFPIERYKDLKLESTKANASETLIREFEERKEAEISNIYALPELLDNRQFYQNEDSYRHVMKYGLPSTGKVDNPDNVYYWSNPTALKYIEFTNTYPAAVYLGKDGSRTITAPQKGEVIINISEYLKAEDCRRGNFDYGKSYALSVEQLSQYAQNWKLFDGKISASSYQSNLFADNKLYRFHSGEFEVVGVVGFDASNNQNIGVGIFCEEDYEALVSESRPESLFVYFRNYSVASSFINKYVGEFSSGVKGVIKTYVFSLPFSEQVYSLSITFKILSLIFFWMSVIMCIFAALLLLNFISASVTGKKKEIGILRAIGARKIDVVSIFLWEGLIIGAIVLLISTLFVVSSIILFNNLIGALAGVPFTMLVVGVLPILFMALVCFVTIAVASILPTRRVASMKPMDAIRSV